MDQPKTDWRDNPTPENYHRIHTPQVEWKWEEEWMWPYKKFGYRHPNVLWDSLYTQFNCMPFAIQDPYMWHADVREVGLASDTREEFEAALRKRRDERFNEILDYWEKTKTQLVASPIIWKAPPRGPSRPWTTFVRLGRHFSFDTFTGHFANYMVKSTDALYAEELNANANAASAASATPADALVSSSARQRQQEQAQQPRREYTRPSPSPPPHPTAAPVAPAAPTANTNSTATATATATDSATSKVKPKPARVTRTSKGPSNRSRVEKPPPRQRTDKAKPREGVRRSARLREQAGRGS
ncbi:hypothetical protein F5Y01DRAFT_322737 [Xylaria sp. FL0043]|nr:hypothetical protein F5Y01DRAFT_322737 [Xylaria sp. FL0043]